MGRRIRCVGTLALLLMIAGACDDDQTGPIDKNPTPVPITSPEAVVKALSTSYQHRDLALFKSILAHDVGRNASYVFFLSEPTELGETQWGNDEEVKIERRMFDPQVEVIEESLVPPQLWLSAISINLTQLEDFVEREDLYSANHGVDGKLDPDIWKAVDARYGTDVFFDTQSDNDFQVSGEANFVVIEDKTKRAGDSGKFLLYIWEDLGSATPKPGDRGTSAMTWTSMKRLYR